MAGDHYTVTVEVRKVTFVDKKSSAGGLLGGVTSETERVVDEVARVVVRDATEAYAIRKATAHLGLMSEDAMPDPEPQVGKA